MTDLVSLNQVNELAIKLGSTTFYTPFKRAFEEDAEVLSTVVRVNQGKRTVSYVPRDVAARFANKFAQSNPKTPITKPDVQQMPLPLESDDRINRLEALVVANHNRLINIEHQLVKLLAMWETLEDDNK